MSYKCRLAGADDAAQILDMFEEYNADEALGRTLKLEMAKDEVFRESIGYLIEGGMVTVAYEENNEKELIGFTVSVPGKGIEVDQQNRLKGLEEAGIAHAKELMMDYLAPIYAICNVCTEIDKIGKDKDFTYLEILGTRRAYRGKGVGTLLVQEFERLEKERGNTLWQSVATAVGTAKILDKLGWERYNSLQTETFEFCGTRPFASLTHEIHAYRKKTAPEQ
eukprot:TRINITY_DN13452_c0_g1_i2.p1 TRINITY_DN13452_c0_g1~~TRINITY_DN13452_c0_g1_i2.p1  ORF type:complete len:222 (+),score=40.20 TRINITY_DN13452_c0_g1_i2:75-740(+)